MIETGPPPIGPDSPWLAPLAGFSDVAFRRLCREFGAAVTFTEMVSAKGLLYNSPGTAELLRCSPDDEPLVLQLFGTVPAEMARATALLKDQGFPWFDVNAGCPVRKVVKTGAGAALAASKDSAKRLAEIVAAMTTVAGRGRVGVKTRLGWTPGFEHAGFIAEQVREAGAGWITLHPRFGKAGFSGVIDPTGYERVAAAGLPVVASGDLFTARAGVERLAVPGVSGVMFARGAMADPGIFLQYFDILHGRAALSSPPGPAAARLIRRHVALLAEYEAPAKTLHRLRGILPRYVKGLACASRLRKDLISCNDMAQLENIVLEIESAPEAPSVALARQAPERDHA